MSMQPIRRVSFSELENFLASIYTDDELDSICPARATTEQKLTNGFIARLVGLHLGVVQRYRHADIPWYVADKIAVALDIHPTLIWHDFHPELVST